MSLIRIPKKTDNGGYGVYLSHVTLTSYSGNSGTGNGINGFGVSGIVKASHTWSMPSSTLPFVLTGEVEVSVYETLTLFAGTIVKGDSTGQLTVKGTLDVNGTSSDWVVFTSLKDDSYGGDTNGDGSATFPSPGDWLGIYLHGPVYGNQGNGYFDYCRIRYGGNTAGAADANVYFYDSNSASFTNSISEYSANYGVQVGVGRYGSCSPTITHSTFANNMNHGLYASGSTAAPIITDNTFTDNGGYGVYLSHVTLTSYSGNSGTGNGINGFGVSGIVKASHTWSMPSSTLPFVLTGEVEVSVYETLTLFAGTIVKGDSTGQLTVKGTLDVNGTSSDWVVFTSLKDDSYGGDTNGDGSATFPSPGDWLGIYLHGPVYGNQGNGYFDYCRIRYGGNTAGAADANVYFYDSNSASFTNSISEYSANYGVQVGVGRYGSCSPIFRESRIVGNISYGIYISGGTPDLGANDPQDKGMNTILNNDSSGPHQYQVYNATSKTINAYYNFWGYTTAPEIDAHIRDNEEGGGEVYFDPWLTEVVGGPSAEAGPDQTVDEGKLLTFDGSGSSAPDGTIESYHWDFGDGSSAMGQTVQHTYSDDGIYTVTLTVTDDKGATDTDTLTVTVNNVSPKAVIEQVIVSNEDFLLPNETVSFIGSFTDPGTADTHTILWDFGEGQTVSETLTPTHSYAEPGTYTVTLTVTDDDSGIGTDSVSLVVLSASEALTTLDAYIQDLPDAAFKGPASQRKNAFSQKLAEVSALIAAGKMPEAIDKLQHDIRAKMDGSVGGNPKNDWITDPEAQSYLTIRIDALIAYLSSGIPAAPVAFSSPPRETRLSQNFPNPFNPETWIPYTLAEDAVVSVEIYDMRGQRIRQLDLGYRQAGYYLTRESAAYWNGRNERGELVASGVYFYVIRAGEFTATKKMVIAR